MKCDNWECKRYDTDSFYLPHENTVNNLLVFLEQILIHFTVMNNKRSLSLPSENLFQSEISIVLTSYLPPAIPKKECSQHFTSVLQGYRITNPRYILTWISDWKNSEISVYVLSLYPHMARWSGSTRKPRLLWTRKASQS